MRILQMLIFIISLALLSSCARPGKKETQLKFTLGAMFVADGEAMLWGKNLSNGEAFGKIVSLAPVEIDLSLGQWNFYVTAWGGAGISAPLSGKAICDFKSAVIDSGSTPEVVFDLSNSKCAQPQFGPTNSVTIDTPDTIHYFPPARVINCQDVNGPLHETDWANCERGFYSSYEIVVKEFGAGATGGELVSNCVAANQADGYQSDTVFANLPVGDGVGPFQYKVRGYIGTSDCDATANPGAGDPYGFREFTFLDGISGGAPGVRVLPHTGNTCVFGQGQPGQGTQANCDSAAIYCVGGSLDGKITDPSACTGGGGSQATHTGSWIGDGTANKLGIILPSSEGDVCTPERMYSDFAGGTGNPGRPYLICTADQFNKIDDDATLMASNFEIVNDLDFHNSSGGNCAAFAVAFTLNPIGGGYETDCSTTASILTFTGSLDGRNHTLSNARFRNEQVQGAGLVAKLGSGGVVKNIKLRNVEISAQYLVGGITGQCTTGTIDNIVMEDTQVEARQDVGMASVGGVVGHSAGCSLSNLYLYGVDIEGRGDYIGGIVGNSTAGTISNADFFGSAEGMYENGNDAQYVGGIAGYSVMTINGVVVQGLVLGDQYVGGVAGNAGAGQSIANASVMALIHSKKMVNDNTTKLYLGGIVGNATAGSISQTMFLGSIDHECKHPTLSNCAVGKFGGSLVGVTYAGQENYNPIEYTSVNGLAATAGHHGDEIPMANFFDNTHNGGSEFTSYDFASAPIWTHATGDIPRLFRHSGADCAQAANLASVPAQVAAGRGGSYENAITLCNVTQVKAIGSNFDKIYRVEDNISLWGMAETDVTNALSGQIWGDDHVFFGGYFQPASDTFALFKNIASTGKIVDLKFAGVQMDTASRNGIGIVSASNSGLIKDVEVIGGLVKGAQAIGGIAAYNESTGEIIDVEVYTKIDGTIQVGGIVGVNDYASGQGGYIHRAISGAHIIPGNGSTINVGGVVGVNKGTISESMYEGRMEDIPSIPLYLSGVIGGIAGINMHDGGSTAAGSIVNSSFDNQGSIRIRATGNVGGIVGTNQGYLNNNVSSGAVTYDFPPNAVPSNYRAIAGGNSGGNADITTDNWYSRFPFSYFDSGLSYFASPGACFFDGTDTVFFLSGMGSILTEGPGTTKMLRLDYDDSLIIPIKNLANLTDQQVKIAGQLFNGTNICSLITGASIIDMWDTNPDTTLGTHLTPAEAINIDSYCPGASSGDKYFVCSSGLDVTEEYQGTDGVGTQRVLDYFLIGDSAPTTPPVWVMEPGNEPKLFMKNND